MKILVADDDLVSCKMMERTLQRGGYEVVVARNGREACEILARADGPRLALIDWMMPELDGPGVCREIRRRKDGTYTYILLLTAKQSQEDIVEGLEAGADDYLTKPCNPAELNARLLTGQRILELERKLVEAREAMQLRAMYDGLTSLRNRTAILAELDSALQTAGTTSVIILDIDHFKFINDTFGHLAGDSVLQQVASTLRKNLPPLGCVGRYGGEEFLVVLPDCPGTRLAALAERLRQAVAESACHTDAGDIQVTISGGAVSFQAGSGIQAKSVVAAADSALYRAKGSGRNRILMSSKGEVACSSELVPSYLGAPPSPPMHAKDALLVTAAA